MRQKSGTNFVREAMFCMVLAFMSCLISASRPQACPCLPLLFKVSEVFIILSTWRVHGELLWVAGVPEPGLISGSEEAPRKRGRT